MTAPAGQSETVVILDFGSQYAQLIARRVRENGVHSLLARPDVTLEEVRDLNPKGLIFTGGPASVYDDAAPRCRAELLERRPAGSTGGRTWPCPSRTSCCGTSRRRRPSG